MSGPRERLSRLSETLTTSRPSIGTLKFKDIELELYEASNPLYLPHGPTLDLDDPFTRSNLYFMLQKYLLEQDTYILSEPGPYARRLAMTFAKLINMEYEYVALHRDCGERELKQAREIRAGEGPEGTTLVFADSPTVRAIKHGRILILEGIERAERGVMPILSNILENREVNLEDGTHIVHPHRMALIQDSSGKFIPAHKNFRVIAIGAPTDIYPGLSLDPPFRSRYSVRFIHPLGASNALARRFGSHGDLHEKLKNLILLSTQLALDEKQPLKSLATQNKPFPQTAAWKLAQLFNLFSVETLRPIDTVRLLRTIHPELTFEKPASWVSLQRQSIELGLGALNEEEGDLTGLLGYILSNVERKDSNTATLHFTGPKHVVCTVPAGPLPFVPLALIREELLASPRFISLLTDMAIAHALKWDISLVPPQAFATATTSASILLRTFARILGYAPSSIYLYKDVGGREIVMRRIIHDNGATGWAAQPLVEGVMEGKLVHLDGVDLIGSTAGILSRFTTDRELDLWEGKRLVFESAAEVKELLMSSHQSARIITTASKSLSLTTWLTAEHVNAFFTIPLQPMDLYEEETILAGTGCSHDIIRDILAFSQLYRGQNVDQDVTKRRKLGTRTLLRIARHMKQIPTDFLTDLFDNALHLTSLPEVERSKIEALYADVGLEKRPPTFFASPVIEGQSLIFPSPTAPTIGGTETKAIVTIPLYDIAKDPDGAAYIPHLDHFYDNSMQTGCMRNIVIDLLLGEHLVILGNQGVGKNKIVDRLCQLLQQPREYVQLHTDTTPMQLMLQASLEGGTLKYKPSPLLRAIEKGRLIMIDEADKASEHVTSIFRSLATQGELTLPDGRQVRTMRQNPSDVLVHPEFRMIILANRPSYPFLGNNFVQVLGEGFSHHIISNPDPDSEVALLTSLAPELTKMINPLVAAFQDLRLEHDKGTVGYPYSLRELIHLVRHLHAYPNDSVESALRNVFDFDVFKPETMRIINDIFKKHGLVTSDIGLSKPEVLNEIEDVSFEPKDKSLGDPKEGLHDDEEHQGGNQFAGGTGGRSTAGVGGRGGYKRFWKGGPIKQVSDELKEQVPEHIKEKARKMAQEEFAARLKELDMSAGDAKQYDLILSTTQSHISTLWHVFEHLAAKEKERVWLKHQTEGELDDARLVEGLTGEKHVYKRRKHLPPDAGRPQIKPKRIRFLFDLSASMYRFQYDGRLKRSLETAVMIMEVFVRLSRKDKYVWDIIGHSGDGPNIELVTTDSPPLQVKDRAKVAEKMRAIPEYAFAGDYTLEAIHQSAKTVGQYDADDWFVIALTDANFERYGITADQLGRAMRADKKVKVALICIGEGAEAPWVSTKLSNAYRVLNTSDIPTVMKTILTSLLDRDE